MITPLTLAVPEAQLEDLRARLERTRWPEPETVDDWSQGVPLAYVRELCAYWASEYDWRRVEQAALDAFAAHRRDGTGYSKQQSTRPQTLGYGLVDLPAAQCAWIVEKFRAWTDEHDLSHDELLDNVMLYWLPGTGASSARLYWESFRERDLPPIEVPAGVSVFPREIFPASRRWEQRRFRDLLHYNELDRGGHLAVFEQPELFVEEVRATFRGLTA